MTDVTFPGHDLPRYAEAVRDGSRWVTRNGGYPAPGVYRVKAMHGGLTIRDEAMQVVSHAPYVEPFAGRCVLQCPDGTERETTLVALLAWLVPLEPRNSRETVVGCYGQPSKEARNAQATTRDSAVGWVDRQPGD